MTANPLLVVATGSSAAIILTAYLEELRDVVDREITVLLTASAERFVRPEVVGWFADRVVTSDTQGVNPVHLALTAEAVVVLPATANTLSSAALGLMPTPALTVLGAAGPALYFPHMNGVLWARQIIQQHVATLRARGDVIVAPVEETAYEIWRGARHPGLSMPGPAEAAAVVRDWLATRGCGADQKAQLHAAGA